MAGSITRGPWTVQPFGHGAEIIGGDGRRVASVCVRYDRDAAGAVFPDVQGAAGNARAIAEVPAMIEALDDIADYLRGDMGEARKRALGFKSGDLCGNILRLVGPVLDRIDGGNPNPPYVVDGHESDGPESDLAGDGQFPPFYVFDTGAQENVAGPFESRDHAQSVADAMTRDRAAGGQDAENCEACGFRISATVADDTCDCDRHNNEGTI